MIKEVITSEDKVEISYDKGCQEHFVDTTILGKNVDGEEIKLITRKNEDGIIIRLKILNI